MAKFAFDAPAAENRIKVAVIGAGPSGLATSYFLAKAGFDVTIFEKEADAGGIVKNILPQFRLPEEAIKKDIEFIEKHGILIKFGANADFSIEGLKKNGYKYIYISIGAELSNKSDLQAESGIILNAIDLLKDYRSAMAKKSRENRGGNRRR